MECGESDEGKGVSVLLGRLGVAMGNVCFLKRMIVVVGQVGSGDQLIRMFEEEFGRKEWFVRTLNFFLHLFVHSIAKKKREHFIKMWTVTGSERWN